MKKSSILIFAVLSLGIASLALGHATYTGYSGAPGSNGACASSCHGNPGGTIEISGFPESYSPGQEYEVTISHAGGNAIRQFNGSCRIGTGSNNAGVISSGTNTVTYNNSHETNGIHFSSANLESGTFNWTAPSAGTGEVRLYVAGLQGGHNGVNSVLVIQSQEQTTGIESELQAIPDRLSLSQNYPNPFNASTTVEFSLAESQPVRLVIYDLMGNEVQTLINEVRSAGSHIVIFDGSGLSSGVYFYRLQAGATVETRRMVLLK
jgi:hypothetical protein